MSDHEGLIDTYIACWNEADAGRRTALAREAFAETATYTDPLMEGSGAAGIAAMIGAAQAHFPGHRFSRRGGVDAHHNLLRFAWDLAPEGGPAIAAGTDIAELTADGRFARVIGFIDMAPGA
ncbi:nuclear transport factor 2 family protein [Belnapia sp. T6]|uniref:Nuclear transport factor 2 family protein n=1 Tax=Belnapia mucosa TaxID=2804532 RepID=A0ABS1V3E4_9PROT|nr:nuclear transport factor 2 family protein [Belnapia mucosa]MBL6454838.1 nuclear transport factor 2 family protein [Belnapia mucosa]